MYSVRFLQLDVFCQHAGGGNPLGVVLDAAAWTSAEMQRFAAWIGLVETTFLLPPSVPEASYRVRIFTPSREIPFAGHPSIGSAHAALHAGLVQPREGLLVQECGAGLLPVRVEGEGAARALYVQAPAARVVATGFAAATGLEQVLRGVPLGPLPPAFVEGGRRWCIAEFADEATVRGWAPDHNAILALARASDSLGLCVFARTPGREYDLVVRAFPAGVGIVEDPASGAANGLIASWIAIADPTGALGWGYRVSQGREIGHDARIEVRIEGTKSIWVGGQTQTVIDGNLQWPLLSSVTPTACV